MYYAGGKAELEVLSSNSWNESARDCIRCKQAQVKGPMAVRFKAEVTPDQKKNIRKGVLVMPRGDGTGPAGMGPMTGRAAGYCAGYNTAGFMNPYGGRGFAGRGAGMGRGRGYRNAYYATGLPFWARYPVSPAGAEPYYAEAAPVDEMDQLKQQADALKQQLDQIQARMEELGKPEKEE